jgi:uncharacterized protein YjbI with pentapeptide repeats
MADQEHLGIIRRGVAAWNQWREEVERDENSLVTGDLSGADLRQMNLGGANFRGSDLSGADLRDADLSGTDFANAVLTGANLYKLDLRAAALKGAVLDKANLVGANLRFLDLSSSMSQLEGANLMLADLTGANLSGAVLDNADLSSAYLDGADFSRAFMGDAVLRYAHLSGAKLIGTYLHGADFTHADLSGAHLDGAHLNGAYLIDADLMDAFLPGADLRQAVLVRTNLTHANIEGCRVYGTAAWAVTLDGTRQSKLVITDEREPVVEVDELDVAQFVYLLLNNRKIRNVINTVGQKAVLILGRFSPERKEILDAIADQLRQRGFLPMMFDFEKSAERDFTETIKILAGLSLFIIADITNPKSNPLELQAVVPDYMVPLVPIIQKGEEPFAMFVDLQIKYRAWVLDVLEYDTKERLLAVLEKGVIRRALSKHNELVELRARAISKTRVEDFL